jgi:hypothetical protein
MSEFLAAAAEKMGMPESLVMRSAEAKAKAQGVSVDDLLREWAGGEAAQPSAAPAADAPAAAPAEAAPAAAPATEPTPVPAAVAAPPRRHVIAKKDPDAAPVLEVERDSHVGMLATIVTLVAIGAVLAALLPTQAVRQEVNDSIGSQPNYSNQAIAGRGIYLAEGCWTCHSMVVRATATDYGLGPVTTPKDVAPLAGETFGVRRIGPDLSHIGSRLDPALILSYLEDPGVAGDGARHPHYGYLSDDELGDLTAFLVETK